MLQLRPTCENCHKARPPDSAEARICSYECTFCATCVERVLGNVCPNCGGGFTARPVRPARNWKGDNYLGKDPASTVVKHRPVDSTAHAGFAAEIRRIPPEEREATVAINAVNGAADKFVPGTGGAVIGRGDNDGGPAGRLYLSLWSSRGLWHGSSFVQGPTPR